MTALSLLVALLNCSAVSAQGLLTEQQGMSAGPMGQLSQSAVLGAEQESLLPPEVVPLEPSVAQQFAQKQAENRAMQAAAPPAGGTPGLVAEMPSGYQTAKDARQDMFKGLLSQGQSQISPVNQYYMQNMQKPPGMNGQGYDPYSQNSGQTGQGQVTQMAAHQTQVLTGGSKNPPQIQETKKGGFSNAFSSTLGGGAMIMRGGTGFPSSLGGLGFFGLGATGFGTRNGFRL